MKPLLSAACLIACAAPASIPSAAGGKAQPREMQSLQVSIDELKRAYLSCEDAAASGITMTDAMRCSIVYETLKKHAFGGNYAKLRQWTETQMNIRPLPKQKTLP